MPMVSQAQRRYLWSRHPDVAREFEASTPEGKELPERLHPSKRKKRPYKALVDREFEK
jgi:hypothetical protein